MKQATIFTVMFVLCLAISDIGCRGGKSLGDRCDDACDRYEDCGGGDCSFDCDDVGDSNDCDSAFDDLFDCIDDSACDEIEYGSDDCDFEFDEVAELCG